MTKMDKRSIKRFRCWLVESKQYVYDIKKICDGKLIKSFAEILNNPEKYVVEQETGAVDIAKNKIREGDIAKYRGVDFEREIFEWRYGVVIFKDCGFELYDPKRDITQSLVEWSIKSSKIEVVGNIHENIELLADNRGHN